MKNKALGLFLLFSILYSSISFAEAFKIPLNSFDQSQLTNEIAKIDYKYRTEEVINENTPSWYVLRKYNYLNDSQAFYINCSEEFHGNSTVGTNKKCEIGFDYALSSIDSLNVHSGFMEDFAIAEIKDQILARDLYKSLGNGVSPTTNYFSKEQLSFTHPTAGNKFSVFRLRIECKRDDSYKNFSCTVYSVK